MPNDEKDENKKDTTDDRFAKLALERGFVSPAQMDDARATQRRGKNDSGITIPLQRILEQKGFVTPTQAATIREMVAMSSGDLRRLGKYEIISTLGQGGMGSVYLATDTLLDRKVALKVLSPQLTDEQIVLRFKTEAKLAAQLKHPNIATLHEFGRDPDRGYYYMAMEYFEGRDLGAMLRDGDAPPLSVALGIFASIAGALQYAHDSGIVHRDVKPSNIMITPDGLPAIVDLGLAMPSSGDTLSAEGTFLGSPYFCSPEQVRSPNLTAVSDIYSLGATMFHVLSLRVVYEGQTAMEILHRHASPDEVDMSPLAKAAPEYVTAIVAKCLRKKPEERYQTADEVRRALEAAIEHLEMSQSDTIAMTPPAPGKTVLLQVEYREANLAGAYREFEFRERIGGGTFGEVWRARQTQAGREVAVKILRSEWVDDREQVARFRREATVLSRFEHENIVRVYNYGRWGASFFIEMELVEGPHLAHVVAERAPVSPADAIHYVAPVLDGLAALHEAGAMHRDLKPENVKVAGDRVVVIDLGLAGGHDLETITMTSKFMGTPPYAAPEQFRGEAQPASDVYAAGVILYELLTKRLPHEAETTLHLIHKKVDEAPKAITEYRGDLPGALVDAVHRMLATDPAERPSATEAREVLASV